MLKPIIEKRVSNEMKGMDMLVKKIVKDMEAGKSVSEIAKRTAAKEELVNQVLQIYTTHPGIDVDGILNRLDIWGM